MLELLQSIFSNIWTLALAVIFLGVSIFVHELGHFLLARWRGVHVERFSIGFGPAIWSFRGRDGVDYRISWIPLGGYVLLPQLADLSTLEGKSEADVAQLPPISYVSKMIVFVAGATFNVLFAFVIACGLWAAGMQESSYTLTTRVGYIVPKVELPDHTKVPSPAAEAGLRAGDTIKAIDGHVVKDWNDVRTSIVLGDGHDSAGQRETVFHVERDGKPLDITLHPVLSGDEGNRAVGVMAGCELLIYHLEPGSFASKLGFEKNDELTRLDDVVPLSPDTVQDYLSANPTKPIVAHVLRNGVDKEITIPARPEPFDPKQETIYGLTFTTHQVMTHPSPLGLVWDQVEVTFRSLSSFVSSHSDVGLSKASGPIGMIHNFKMAAEAGFRMVLLLAILVNVNLAIFNLLPIPILDGGQMMFATIARFRGRALPVNFVMAAQSVCLVLLLTLIVYVGFFDTKRWVHEAQEDRAAAAAAQQSPAQKQGTAPAAAPAK